MAYKVETGLSATEKARRTPDLGRGKRARPVGANVLRKERSVILGLGSVRFFAVVSRNRVAARKPTAEVDIGASSRTKWPKSLDRRSPADRTRLRVMRFHRIAHAANIGTAAPKGKGPQRAGVAERDSNRSAQEL
jgi:hypothetical protein